MGYAAWSPNTFPKNYTLEEFHIVLDCANGATYGVAPHVFTELGAKVTTLSATPDGKNINHECGALHPKKMAVKVKELGADIGLALDGDGDRLIVCDEHGEIVDGDHVMAICAKESFGGEQSGHLIFLDQITTGDGILAGLQLLAIMKKRKQPLSELATIMESFPQVLKNVRTSTKIDVASIQNFPETVVKLEKQLGRTGRILVRPSGTEPVIRVMVEGQDEVIINEMADELCNLVQMADRN